MFRQNMILLYYLKLHPMERSFLLFVRPNKVIWF